MTNNPSKIAFYNYRVIYRDFISLVELSKPSEQSERGFGSSERLTYVCGTLCLATCLAQFASNLQRLMRGGARSTSAKKKFEKKIN